MDDTKEPARIFCDQMKVASNKDVFILWLKSGGETSTFVTTPDHAKQIAKVLTSEVEKYEKEFGPLEGRLPTEPAPSPFKVEEK